VRTIRLVFVLGLVLLFVGSLVVVSFADDKAGASQPTGKDKTVARQGQDKGAAGNAATTSKGPVYKPPKFGAPGGRVGGGTRGIGSGIDNQSLTLIALVPNHKALTIAEQPVLYWYLSKPSSYPIEFVISEEKAVAPLAEKRLPMPGKGGIYGIPLKEYDLKLRPNTSYRWFVTVVPDGERRSKDIVAGGIVERIGAPADLAKKIASTDKNQLHYVYAEAGIWYDALMAISDAIQAQPGDERLSQERSALLQQVGLGNAVKKAE
jgi:hypothetical protein